MEARGAGCQAFSGPDNILVLVGNQKNQFFEGVEEIEPGEKLKSIDEKNGEN